MKLLRLVLPMKVNEIFSSFQGEGVYTGVPATFLRLSGCNLNCDFCDTEFEEYKELSVELVKESILQHMKNHNTELLVITGGEPLLQYEELKLLLKELDCNIQIETNGTIQRIPFEDVCYVVSPKKNIENIFKFYKDYDKTCFKFVITCQEDIDLIEELRNKYNFTDTIWLQGEFSKANEMTTLILNNNLRNIRISGQLHKYLNQQ